MSKVSFPVVESGTLFFRCNICGASCDTLLDRLTRETSSCASCGSTPRYRAIIRALTLMLFQESVALPDIERHPEITGLGLTDWDNYASRLREKFDYQNTFYHQEPKLDISARSIAHSLLGSQDFIISSDVFEHVAPPVERAFENALHILKPGGALIFTVPYGLQAETIEHFPGLNEFNLFEQDGAYVLRNTTIAGEVQEFHRLVFHGGPGATLEMRVFAQDDLLRRLHRTGFEEAFIHRSPDFAHGIWWPEPWSLPITARKPVVHLGGGST